MSFLFLGLPLETRLSLDCCRISHRRFWQSDIVTANGRQIDREYLLPVIDGVEAENSRYIFGREQPTTRDWVEWKIFWAKFTTPGLYLHRPLGRWVAPSHREWCWFYNPLDNTVEEVVGETVWIYLPAAVGRRTRNSDIPPQRS